MLLEYLQTIICIATFCKMYYETKKESIPKIKKEQFLEAGWFCRIWNQVAAIQWKNINIKW